MPSASGTTTPSATAAHKLEQGGGQEPLSQDPRAAMMAMLSKRQSMPTAGSATPTPTPAAAAPVVDADAGAGADPRAAMMAMLKRRQSAPDMDEMKAVPHPAPDPAPAPDAYAKYLKMVKYGLPIEAAAQTMFKDGVVGSMDDGLRVLDGARPGTSVTAPGGGSSAASGTNAAPAAAGMVMVKDHPDYSKYFKMVKVGLPLEAVKHKMHKEGFNPAVLDKVHLHTIIFSTKTCQSFASPVLVAILTPNAKHRTPLRPFSCTPRPLTH